MKYLEQYQIVDHLWGIEESRLKSPKNPRYRLWENGVHMCGRDTIELARSYIFDKMHDGLQRDREDAEAKVHEIERAINRLGDDPFNLGRFVVEE